MEERLGSEAIEPTVDQIAPSLDYHEIVKRPYVKSARSLGQQDQRILAIFMPAREEQRKLENERRRGALSSQNEGHG